MNGKKIKQLTPSEKSFGAVKEFVVANFPDFANIALFACDEADKMHEESATEQAEEGKPPRVYAHTGHFEDVVCYSTYMDGDLSEEQRQGIFIHEFGHLYAKRYPYNAETDEYFEWEEDSDADLVVVTIFEVNLHYDDDDIECVVLPIGSELIENTEASDEEVEQTLQEIEEKYGTEEEEEEEEISEFDLGLPSAEELRDSISDTFRKAPVIDTELEPVEGENGRQEEGETE